MKNSIIAYELVRSKSDRHVFSWNVRDTREDSDIISAVTPVNLQRLDFNTRPEDYGIVYVTYKGPDNYRVRERIIEGIQHITLSNLPVPYHLPKAYFDLNHYNSDRITETRGLLWRLEEEARIAVWPNNKRAQKKLARNREMLSENPAYVLYSGLLDALNTMTVQTFTVPEARQFVDEQLAKEREDEFTRTSVKWGAANRRLCDIYGSYLRDLPDETSPVPISQAV